MTETLPFQRENLYKRFGTCIQRMSLREALEFCCNEAYEHLPFELKYIYAIKPEELGAVPWSIVVAEKISRVPDSNRFGKNRVDLFVYHPTGEVVRHHPGGKKNTSAATHSMPVGSTLFHLAYAKTHGVGEALHSYPPGYAQMLNSLAPPQVDLELAVTRSQGQ